MYSGIFKALWIFINIMTTFYDILNSCIRKLKVFYLKSYDLVNDRRGSYEFDYLELCKAELNKIPKHLSIIFGHDDESDPDVISKLAVYALIMNIDYISFFDTRGQLTLEKMNVPKFVSSKKMQNGNFLWSWSGEQRKSAQLTYKNGIKKIIEVVALSPKDGKPLIAEVCREFFANRNTTEVQEAMKDRTCLANKITETLQKKLNHLPDPDCAIIFNKHMCTFGILPWNTGFTEFHLIETGSYFNVGTFARVLYKFSKCEQRFGQ